MFEIKRGTKQAEPLSSLLFNTVLQVALKNYLPRWQKKKGMGICLGDHELDCLTNLRFADDVLLFATSMEQLQKMMCEFQTKHRKGGTQGISRKTKILNNQSSSRRKEMEIDNIKVEPKKKAQNILDKWLHSSNRRQPRSRIESGLPGRRFTNTSKS